MVFNARDKALNKKNTGSKSTVHREYWQNFRRKAEKTNDWTLYWKKDLETGNTD